MSQEKELSLVVGDSSNTDLHDSSTKDIGYRAVTDNHCSSNDTSNDEDEEEEFSYKKELLSKDTTIFREYIENTTAHGLVRIFRGHVALRIFWLIIVLVAAGGCLNNCIDRIRFLASNPNSTATSIIREQPISFPAVTICNLNPLTMDGLQNVGIITFDNATGTSNIEDVRSVINFIPDGSQALLNQCKAIVTSGPAINLNTLYRRAGHEEEVFIQSCTFLDSNCTLEPVLTGLGRCFIFNRNGTYNTSGTGIRRGLSLYMDIQQEQYVASSYFDAGVRINIHSPNEFPMPIDRAIAVAAGRNAFIGLTTRNITDKREDAGCNRANGYSATGCLLACQAENIIKQCGCSFVDNCTYHDLCCINSQVFANIPCDCPSACSNTEYQAFNSYSSLPASYVSSSFMGRDNERVPENIIGVNVYFETLNVETLTTSPAYSAVSLLSDIGGQLGLFLGVSVISISEFVTWLADEGYQRLCCGKRINKYFDDKKKGKKQYRTADKQDLETTDNV